MHVVTSIKQSVFGNLFGLPEDKVWQRTRLFLAELSGLIASFGFVGSK